MKTAPDCSACIKATGSGREGCRTAARIAPRFEHSHLHTPTGKQRSGSKPTDSGTYDDTMEVTQIHENIPAK
jgi:hypothetical protein